VKPKNYLLYDVQNLAYRAFYSVGGLNYNNTPTGVYFQVLGTVLQLEGQFGPATPVFCFDSKESKRKKLYPNYKKARHTRNLTQDQLSALLDLRNQISGLRTKYLKLLGCHNIFRKKGYEADDLIAYISQGLRENERAVIVSTDSDLLQCLSVQVKIYDPRKKFLWTVEHFRKAYGIEDPKNWAAVKALSGCSTDGVKGIPGIGEKTAVKFVNFTLSESSKKYQQILSKKGLAIRRRNLPLVKLPFSGIKSIKLIQDGELQWSRVFRELGIRSLDAELEYREIPKQQIGE
jgi:DNA polymerase I